MSFYMMLSMCQCIANRTVVCIESSYFKVAFTFFILYFPFHCTISSQYYFSSGMYAHVSISNNSQTVHSVPEWKTLLFGFFPKLKTLLHVTEVYKEYQYL